MRRINLNLLFVISVEEMNGNYTKQLPIFIYVAYSNICYSVTEAHHIHWESKDIRSSGKSVFKFDVEI